MGVSYLTRNLLFASQSPHMISLFASNPTTATRARNNFSEIKGYKNYTLLQQLLKAETFPYVSLIYKLGLTYNLP